ncbi:MAG: helix-turn-helix domain-containing protein [Candidatus Korarchaeota archaeon]|nr:helix-turn-helix domain-containing protein [Candidatus Korarchaeota archaeon]
MAGEYALKELLELMKLLSSETRLRILEILAEEPVYLEELARQMEMTRQAVLKHLEALSQLGIVSPLREQRGPRGPPRTFYMLNRSVHLSVHVGRGGVLLRTSSPARPERVSIEAVKRLMEEGESLVERDPEAALKLTEEALSELSELEAYVLWLRERAARRKVYIW